jgi:hypothetical protein
VFDFQSGLFRQRTVRPDARGNHHQVRRDLRAILQQNAFHPFTAEDLACHGIFSQRYADPVDVLAQDFSRPLVQLARKEPPVTFQESHVSAALGQRPGGLQAQNSAADTDAAGPGLARFQQQVRILDRPHARDPRAIRAGDGWNERTRAGG